MRRWRRRLRDVNQAMVIPPTQSELRITNSDKDGRKIRRENGDDDAKALH